MSSVYAIIVLDDGKTWSLAHDCAFMVIGEPELTLLQEGESLQRIDPLVELAMYDITGTYAKGE